jgi:outer membrane protein assembly factor BamE (lipoprotein component of BamABCDE complex)
MQITILRTAAGLLIAAGFLGAVGCVYHMPIQQGNHLDATVIAQVKPGMTRAQVRYLLGTPMVPGGFQNDRWDYDYYLKLRRLQHPYRSHVVVHFRNDLVDHVDSDVKGNPAEHIITKPVNAPGA